MATNGMVFISRMDSKKQNDVHQYYYYACVVLLFFSIGHCAEEISSVLLCPKAYLFPCREFLYTLKEVQAIEKGGYSS